MSHTLQIVISLKMDLALMGTGYSNYGKYVGMLAAITFIAAAFVMLLVKDSSLAEGTLTETSQIVLTVAGAFTFIAGILLTARRMQMSAKYDGILIMLLGIVAALTYVLVKISNMDSVLVVEIIGIVGIVTMLSGCMIDLSKKRKAMMYVDLIFILIEAILVVLMFMGTSLAITEASAIIVIGLWLATYLVMGTDEVAEESTIDPNRKSAKKAQKQKAKADAEAKKKQDRQEKLDSMNKSDKGKHKKEEPKAESKKDEAKAEHKKHEAKKEEPKAEPEPAKEAPKERIKETPAEPAKEVPKPEPVPVPVVEEKPAEPAKEEPKKPNNDFMSKLVSSKDVGGKVVPPVKEQPAEPVAEELVKAEPEPAKEEPVPEPAPAVEEKPAEEIPEPEPVAEAPAEPVEEEPIEAPVAESVLETVVAAGVVAEEVVSEEPEDEEVLEDIYTDYSPEALVRRAAWNKGMRCRRDYGDYHIPVAFVKGKVAVYVEEPGSEDKEIEAKLKDEGWVVLRYDINKVTDGLAEGAEIADAVKANMRAQKAAKKKKATKK